MSKISLQFHATEKEILKLVEQIFDEKKLFLTFIKHRPFTVIGIKQPLDPVSSSLKIVEVDEICFSLDHPNIEAKSWGEYLDINADMLYLTVGKLTDKGLGETFLAGISSKPECLKIWRKIQKMIRSFTRTGAWVLNPKTNAKGFYKNCRFSQGAFDLYQRGVKILPLAGWNVILFEPPNNPPSTP